MATLKWFAFFREDLRPCKAMSDTLAPVECTNWKLSVWNSTIYRNDVPWAWLYGQDHLWATQDFVCSPGGFCVLPPHPPTPARPSLPPLPAPPLLPPSHPLLKLC